ncbi:hypothetical protein FEK33_11005 [Nocardia asteroides NBRC 15531]|uniref:PNPLA domain-containing protein n=1 Tax=Nocardia asteroides NBRC 15531 TaxID=1110697 RepID=U5E7K6_NOCAS|nr:hypothetical protein [Nocardia asteroides]TLF66579.1 hypothetical protein FEK33_11005 [Nocardia asteroides NBRC 15531]UGT46322.1 hypothetical protein LT345_17230 [Nocardia asteroides]SFM95125.1 hypothetical protein SAMN05444423_10598 [Nocardia asteroides]VEG34872.1 Uncharacterised protein [Nocardia asteroides]GAD82403.1 hypothetical protein NCAST_08_02770 [Nocardia asteroides NBRC 15531]
MTAAEQHAGSPVRASGDHVTSGLATIEQVGRGRVFAATTGIVVFLVAVQATMAFPLGVRTPQECHTAGLLGLLVGAMMALAAPTATYRYYVYIYSLRLDRKYARFARQVFACSLLLSVIDGVADLLLALRLRAEPPSCTGATVTLLRVQAGLHLGFLLLALVVTAAIWYFGTRNRLAGEHPSQAHYAETTAAPADRDGLIICCSGGGIRSASFCLGALQVLRDRGRYQSAGAVVGVSGGGYIAAAMHIVGRTFPDRPYSLDSTELAYLRRRTRYLMPRGTDKFRAVFSLLYGIAVNATLIGISLVAVSWWLGWLLDDIDMLTRTGDTLHLHLVPAGGYWYLAIALGPFVLALAAFVVEKAWDRLTMVPDRMRNIFTKASRLLLGIGVPLALLLVGVPIALYWLSRAQERNGALATLVGGLVDPGGRGTVAFGATLLALIGLGRSAWKGLHAGTESGGWTGRIRQLVRKQIAPWLGSALIVAVVVVLLLRWTTVFATEPAARSNWTLAWWLIGIAIAIKLFTDANRTSLHTYYREALSKAFLVEKDPRSRQAVPLPYSTPLRYSEYGRPVDGGPRLVIAAAANADDDAFVPTRRGCVPFIFDPDRIGVVGDRALTQDGRRVTATYERQADFRYRDVTVPAAMAISGAAFSPLTGRESARTRPVRILLALLNARLGVWLPNPYWQPVPQGRVGAKIPAVWSWADKPGPYRLLREAFGNPSLYDRWLYVTDGGHYDNLGLVEALRRRPAAVLVLDASGSPDDRFCALAEAIATARMDHCIEICVDLRPISRGDRKRAAQAWTRGVATHLDGTTTTIYYLRSQLIGGLSWDVENYSTTHPDFPYTSTGDQLYSEWDFEAYRALGHDVTTRALADPPFAELLDDEAATGAPESNGDQDRPPPLVAPRS